METANQGHLEAIEKILGETSVDELNGFLWEMVVACLTTDAPPFSQAGKRADLLLNYQRVRAFLAAGAEIVSSATTEYRAAAA